MRFDVLGPLRASGPNGPLVLRGHQSQAIVCWLVANANEAVSVDSLVSVLWAEPPPSALGKARMLVRSLVLVLGADTLSVGGKVRLTVADDAVDATRFERLVRHASEQVHDGDLQRAQANLDAALELWRGDPFPELRHAVTALPAIEHVQDLHLQAVEERVGLALRGRVDYTLVADVGALVVLHPGRVRLRRQLAMALYRTDRQIEALDTLRRAREDLGTDPLDRQLETAILQRCPSLDRGELIQP